MGDEVLRRVTFAAGSTGDVRLSGGRITAVGDVGHRADDASSTSPAMSSCRRRSSRTPTSTRRSSPSASPTRPATCSGPSRRWSPAGPARRRRHRRARRAGGPADGTQRLPHACAHTPTSPRENGLCSVEALADVRASRRPASSTWRSSPCAGWPVTGPAGADSGPCSSTRSPPVPTSSAGALTSSDGGHRDGDRAAADDRRRPWRRRRPAHRRDARRVASTDSPSLADARHRDRVRPPGHRQPLCEPRDASPRPSSGAIAEAVAAAGITVVALPATNLFLQGRGHPAGDAPRADGRPCAARRRRRRRRRRRQPAGPVQPAGPRLPVRDGGADGARGPPHPCRGLGDVSTGPRGRSRSASLPTSSPCRRARSARRSLRRRRRLGGVWRASARSAGGRPRQP